MVAEAGALPLRWSADTEVVDEDFVEEEAGLLEVARVVADLVDEVLELLLL